MKKGNLKRLLLSGILAVICSIGATNVAFAANDLNDIGNSNTSTVYVEADNQGAPEEISSDDNAAAIGDLFGSTKIDKETAAQAQEAAAPIIKGINWVVAFILAILSAAMLLVTLLDLLYIAVPFIRKFLDGGRADAMSQQQSGGMQGGFDGGMSGGYGGYGGMNRGYGGATATQPVKTNPIGRLVSDEAIMAFVEAQPQQGGGGPMMQQAAPVSTKSVIVSYLKKRVVFLVLMGVCVAVFATTALTDLGVKLGSFIVEKLSGI